MSKAERAALVEAIRQIALLNAEIAALRRESTKPFVHPRLGILDMGDPPTDFGTQGWSAGLPKHLARPELPPSSDSFRWPRRRKP